MGVAAGPDGNVWFTELLRGRVGRITPDGDVAEFTVGGFPYWITAGPDGNLWFTRTGSIGRITPAGVVTLFPVGGAPVGIATGPDGALWFADQLGRIGRMSRWGDVLGFFYLPNADSQPWSIITGADGRIWFTENNGNRIGSISMTGVITEYPLPVPVSQPFGLAVGPDGNIWFTELNRHTIGRITLSGELAEFSVPFGYPYGIVTGGDGALWFAESEGRAIGRAVLVSDATPPNVRAVITGSATNGWYTTDVALHWEAADNETGIATRVGCDDMLVTSDVVGLASTCTATNGAGVSTTETVTLNRDATPPEITFTGSRESYRVTDEVEIDCEGSDATSGLASVTCPDVRSPAYLLEPGAHEISAFAADNAGNEAFAQLNFRIHVTYADLCSLIERIVVDHATQVLLCVQLKNAESAALRGNPTAEQQAVATFNKHVERLTPMTIGPADAAALLRLVAAAAP
jgi:sugar lactone lactonase YvrE